MIEEVKANMRRTHVVIFRLAFLFLSFAMAVSAWSRVTVSGYVRDMRSGESLIGAVVRDTLTRVGTTTNAYGFYSLTMPDGADVVLQFAATGYVAEMAVMHLERDTVVNTSLGHVRMLAEAKAVASHVQSGLSSTDMGVHDISIAQIVHTPALLGETDVVRTLQLLPGVQSGLGGSSGLYVRGGNGDENLFLLDGVPVYKVDHLFGFFSVFTPEAMKKVTFYKSAFPARYAGRLSSIVDVRTKDGDMRGYHGSASLGLLTSRINIEGPIVRNRTSFNLSARTTYIDLLTRPFMEDDSKFGYKFYDVNLKLNHRFSDRDRLYLSIYKGQDRLKDDYRDDYDNTIDRYGSNMHWGNAIGSLRWNHVFSHRLFANATVAHNLYEMNLLSYDDFRHSNGTWERTRSRYLSQIRDLSAQVDFEYDPLPAHRILFGASAMRHRFRPENKNMMVYDVKDGTSVVDTSYASSVRQTYGTELLFYLEDDWKLGRLSLHPGLTVSSFHVRAKNYATVQPRFSSRFQLSPVWALKAAYTDMAQYVHLLTSMPIAMPTDLWVPITDRVRPERSSQCALGAYYSGFSGWVLSAETYYKTMRNVLEYRDGMSFFGFSGSWEDLVSMGHGRSYGVELMAEKRQGRTTGWIAYTLSKSDRKFSRDSGVNDGQRFPYTYDRRHVMNIFVNHKLSSNVDVDATWMFHSGEAATVATQQTRIYTPNGSRIVDYVPNRNNYRLPCSHTLCLRLNMRRPLKHGVERTWNISLYNAYNAMNPMLVYRKVDDNGNVSPDKLTKYTLLPCIPSFTLTYKF